VYTNNTCHVDARNIWVGEVRKLFKQLKVYSNTITIDVDGAQLFFLRPFQNVLVSEPTEKKMMAMGPWIRT